MTKTLLIHYLNIYLYFYGFQKKKKKLATSLDKLEKNVLRVTKRIQVGKLRGNCGSRSRNKCCVPEHRNGSDLIFLKDSFLLSFPIPEVSVQQDFPSCCWRESNSDIGGRESLNRQPIVKKIFFF